MFLPVNKLYVVATHFFLQIVFKLFQKMSHGRVTLKVIEVIVYPQQDYPCNLQELKGNMSIVVDVLVGHIVDKNKLQVCKIRNMDVDDFYNYYHIHHLFSVNASPFLIRVCLTGH